MQKPSEHTKRAYPVTCAANTNQTRLQQQCAEQSVESYSRKVTARLPWRLEAGIACDLPTYGLELSTVVWLAHSDERDLRKNKECIAMHAICIMGVHLLARTPHQLRYENCVLVKIWRLYIATIRETVIM